MRFISNGKRFKDARLRLAWSQEDLAGACGVSVRTIQRIEQGGAASPKTVKALCAGLRLPLFEFLKPAESPVSDAPIKRITPLMILADIQPTIARYLKMGFGLIETEDEGCVGLKAGNTSLIVVSESYMSGDFTKETAAMLRNKTIPYIYVRSIAEACDKFSVSQIVGQAKTRAGALEALVFQDGQYMILAEKLSGAVQ